MKECTNELMNSYLESTLQYQKPLARDPNTLPPCLFLEPLCENEKG